MTKIVFIFRLLLFFMKRNTLDSKALN